MATRKTDTAALRRCCTCGEFKAREAFAEHKRVKDGLRYACRECERARKRIHQAGWAARTLAKAKERSSARGLPCDLSAQDIISLRNRNTCCPACGTPLVYGGGIVADNVASLDKVIPKLGYVKSNVSFLCSRCNRLKSDASGDELAGILRYISLYEDAAQTNRASP